MEGTVYLPIPPFAVEKRREGMAERQSFCYPDLFSELKVRGKIMKNRTVTGPMILEWGIDKNGFITERGMKAFGDMAKGGAGIVTLGEAQIDHLNSKAHSIHFDATDPDVIQQYHFFTEYIHAYGALASIEFNHNGQHALPEFNSEHMGPMAASEIRMPNGLTAKEMDRADMDRVIEAYAQSAQIAKRSGFDAVLLHFGHGWLMGGFLSPLVNRRTDDYGGTYENRMRFPLEVIHRIRQVAGEELIIEVRMSGDEYVEGGIKIEDTVEYAKLLEADGNIDMIHLSAGTRMDGRSRPISVPSHFVEECHNLRFAEAVKKAGVKLPVGIVGAVSDPALADQIIAEGKADYVVMARQMIADPEWANKARHGREADIRRCLRCMHCGDKNRVNRVGKAVLEDWNGTKIHVCDINPVWGHDALIGEIAPPKVSKKIVVVGGGPAGLTAASRAAELGHQVILYESGKKLGGLLNFYADPVWFKQGESRHRKYLIHQVEKHKNIEVRLGVHATPELVKEDKADEVIVAIGGRIYHPDLSIEQGAKIIDVLGVYGHEDNAGSKIVIIGGGTSGAEAAIYLAGLGKKVRLIEKLDDIALDEPFSMRNHILKYMADLNIEYSVEQEAFAVTRNGVKAKDINCGTEHFYEADTVIFATGLKAREEEADAFTPCAVDVVKVGDCRKIGNLGSAIREGYNAAVTVYAEE